MALAMDGDVTFHSVVDLGEGIMVAKLKAILDGVGAAIATQTQENMYPGHFYLTGASHDQTEYVPTGPLSGEMRVPTTYSAYPEYGTVHMAPRPAVRPAVDKEWPAKVYELAGTL